MFCDYVFCDYKYKNNVIKTMFRDYKYKNNVS